MSKIQGIFPLFLATAFGIANGVWVFGPAFKEQKENELQPKLEPVVSDEVDAVRVKDLRDIETAINRASATQSALEATNKSTSWWSNMGIWTQGATNSSTKAKEEESVVAGKGSQATSGQKSSQSDDAQSKSPTQNSVIGKLVDETNRSPELKKLVGAIASGEASTEEMKKFQIHLDELERPRNVS